MRRLIYIYLYTIFFGFFKKAEITPNDANFYLGCDKVEYNSGVICFLENLFNNGVKNYLLSSGIKFFLKIFLYHLILMIFIQQHFFIIRIK